MKEDTATSNIDLKVAVLALSAQLKELIETTFINAELICYDESDELLDNLDYISETDFDLIICGSEQGHAFPLEAGQLFSIEKPDTPLFFIGDKISSVRINELTKNGFQEVFLYPLDKNLIFQTFSKSFGSAMKNQSMVPIRLIKVIPGQVLPFDLFVYLPLNHKFIKYVAASKPLSEERYSRLSTHNVSQIFIKRSDYSQYIQGSVDDLKDILGSLKDDESDEAQEKLKETVRTFFLSLFDEKDEEQNDPILSSEDCQNAVFEFVSGKKTRDLYSTFSDNLNLVSDRYEKAKVVATLASLLARSLRYEHAKELMWAALYQDVSLWKFENDTDIEAESIEEFHQHPQKSLDIIKEKLSGLSENLERIILQHHERYDGKGFPNKLSGDEVCVGAQIINFVSTLCDLTTYQPGKKRFHLEDALDHLKFSGIVSDELEIKIYEVLTTNTENIEQKAS